MSDLIKRYWRIIDRPGAYFSLDFLTLGGFVADVMFWGAFNTAMEVISTEASCTGCHEMHKNVYQELQSTIRYINRSGARAICSNCRVPYARTSKIVRKTQASKEVWGKILSTIGTREKFEAHRFELAQHEWDRLKANDSLECRDCHNYESMNFTWQSPRTLAMYARYLGSKEKTCIDCHKGIAHHLSDMSKMKTE